MSVDGGGPDVHVGLDLGTSGLKGIALDPAGQVLARSRADYATHRPEAGAAEQDPATWLRAVASVVTALLEVVPASRWAGIGLSGMIPTLAVVDSSGRALGPAITWEDARAEDEGLALREVVGAEALYDLTGQWVDGRYLLPMAARLARAGELSSEAVLLLDAKDFVLFWLTGVHATDPSTATGAGAYDLADGVWRLDVVAAAERVAGRSLPGLPAVEAATTLRPLQPARAAAVGLPAGVPVATGAADSVCGLLGLGLAEPGDIAYLAGSSTVIIGTSVAPVRDPRHRYVVTPLALPGYGQEMDLLATGSAIGWLADLLGLDGPAALAMTAADIDPIGPGIPVFAPHVAPGEQGAWWDPTLTGTLAGLSLSHGRAEIARALVSGIVIESARCVEILAETSAVGHEIHLAGSSAPDPLPQDLADATGLDVVVHGGSGWHSAIGAALVCVAGRSGDRAVRDILARRPAPEAVHRPVVGRREAWARLRAAQDRYR